MKIKYAMEACSRCGGSGRYSWCQRYGDRCFKCHGKGTQMTKAARALWKRIEAAKADAWDVTYSEVKVGDVVKFSGSLASAADMSFYRDRFATVHDIHMDTQPDGRESWSLFTNDWEKLNTAGQMIGDADTKVRRQNTPEEWREVVLPIAKRSKKGCTIVDDEAEGRVAEMRASGEYR